MIKQQIIVLGAFKNVLQPLMFQQPYRLIMEQNSKIAYEPIWLDMNI